METKMADFNPQDFEQNPLRKYFRQPKVYTTLPSKGKFYPSGTLEMPETGELPVYAMTAKDELSMKTPDALLNGQATVDLIKSGVPSIKDPWAMPSIDLDALLIAIRIATYGEKMDSTTKVPKLGEERSFEVDLRQLLNKLVTVDFETEIPNGEMVVEIRPLSYKEFTASSLKTFEEQRIFAVLNNTELPDHEKLAKFNESFQKLATLTMEVLTKSVAKISVGDTVVTRLEHIDEFIRNTDKDVCKAITEHLEEQKAKFQIEPLKVHSSKEDIEAGAPATYEVPITFDQSNFFA